MFKRIRSKGNKGQTALEYALVIGVIAVGVIFAGRKIFGQNGSMAEKLMENAVKSAQDTIVAPGR